MYALMSSGGKDCTLALYRARRDGLETPLMVTLYDRESDRVRIHGTRIEVIRAQARAMGLDPLTCATGKDEFDDAFTGMLDQLAEDGYSGVIFGNIHLADVRKWYEDRVRARGLDHVEPLWGGDPESLARESVSLGFQSMIISTMDGNDMEPHLGRLLTDDLLDQLAARGDIDPCGEKGEYHTLVLDGPTFTEPLRVSEGEVRSVMGHSNLDLRLIAKP